MSKKKDTYYKHLELLLDNHPDGMVLSDINGVILAVNNTFASFLHQSKEELIGSDGYQFIERNVGEERGKKLKEIIHTKKPISFIDYERNHWWNTTFYPLCDASGNVTLFIAIIQNITEKYEFEQKYQQLIENINEGVFSINKEGYFTFVSPIIFKFSKLDKKEFFTRHYLDFFLEKDKEFIKKKFKQAISGKKVPPFEVAYYTKPGTTGYIEISVRPNYRNDIVISVNGVVRDITEKKKTNESLRQSQQIFIDLAEQSPNIIFINQHGRLVYTNKKAQELTGYTIKELINPQFDFYSLLAPEYRDKAKNAFMKHQNQQEVPPLEYKVLTKKGETVDVLVTTKLIDYKEGKAILGIITDITRLKEIKEKILQSHEQLQRIINSTTELIFSINSQYILQSWNKAASMVTGYQKKDILGKGIHDVLLFRNPTDIIDKIEEFIKSGKNRFSTIDILTKQGVKKSLEVSASFIKDEKNKVKEVLFVCREVNLDEKNPQSYDFGKGYFVLKKQQNDTFKKFSNFLKNGSDGLFIGRIFPESIIYLSKEKSLQLLLISKETNQIYQTVEHINEVYEKIESFLNEHKKAVVFLDRLDYFVSLYSFDVVLSILYRLHSLVQHKQAILFIQANENVFSNTQMGLLTEEFYVLPTETREDIVLTSDLNRILFFIFTENRYNRVVSYSAIGQRFSLSKATIKKKITELLDKNLIYQEKKGRSKLLFITEKGERLITSKKQNESD